MHITIKEKKNLVNKKCIVILFDHKEDRKGNVIKDKNLATGCCSQSPALEKERKNNILSCDASLRNGSLGNCKNVVGSVYDRRK